MKSGKRSATNPHMSLVVLLRGVNVGGHRTFRPKQFAESLARLDVVNIGAAGTFVVRTKASQAEVRKAFSKELPFNTDIVVCKGSDFVTMIEADPFSGEPSGPKIVRFVSVLAQKPRREPEYPLILPPKGAWLVKLISRRDRFVFGMYRRDMKVIQYLGKTDALFDVPVTTRNWGTVEKIGKAVGTRQ